MTDIPTPTAPPRRPWYSWRRLGLNFLTISIAVHLLFGTGAVYLVVQTIQAKRKTTFAAAPQGPSAPTRALEHKVQMQQKQQTMSAPISPQRITTTANTKVALPSLPAMPKLDSAVAPMNTAGMGGTGTGPGMGMGGRGGGGGGNGAPIEFFGFKTTAKRIAFLADYSGSMSGVFRQAMERDLEASLRKLPAGTQILIIPWAGPAWLYNQTAKQVDGQWQKLTGYDDFALKPGATQTPPAWVTVSDSTVGDLMRGIRGQQSAPGGTDWRQPFRYVMQAKPAPDAIFFMTDGQIPPKNIGRALADIDASLKKAEHVPTVHCMWIDNPTCKPEPLKRIASTYHGEFTEVKSK